MHREDPLNLFRVLRRSLRLLPLIVLLAGCQQPRTPAELVSEAREQAALGQYELAVAAVEKAVALDPADPELRLAAAEIYLDAGRGDLAEATLRQAAGRGLEEWRVLVPRVRAMLLQGRFFDVLSLQPGDGLPPLVGLEFEFVQLVALLAVNDPARSNREITEAVLRLVPKSEAFAGTAVAAEIAGFLDSARPTWPDVERAWQHLQCRTTRVERYQWTPVVRPDARLLRVGAGRRLKTPGEAARIAEDGDVVEIDPGTYEGGIALWPQNRLVVRGASARPKITASGKGVENRDVWLFTGDDVIVENIEISGARSPFENGAGIRHTGSGLQLRAVYLHDNENGVLTGNNRPDSQILIEYSELARNGDAKGYAHNAYIGRSARLEFRFNYSHSSSGGHLLKSRAMENLVAYNRLTDEEDGTSSYVVDIPEGGAATIIGNLIQQGLGTVNHTMISYAGEAFGHLKNELHVLNNTVYNREFEGVFVNNHSQVEARVSNNLFAGAEVTSALGPSRSDSNLLHPQHGLRDWEAGDFRLVEGAFAIDAGADVAPAPTAEYVHPHSGRTRLEVWQRDIGAYERCGI